MQACRAYYSEGRFVPLESLKIPEGSQAIVTILDVFTGEAQQAGINDDVCRRQAEAMRRFREEIRNCDEPVPEFERVRFREIEI
jgi:predicted DNA-binding antitoxin AbrB/MazE fold protein